MMSRSTLSAGLLNDFITSLSALLAGMVADIVMFVPLHRRGSACSPDVVASFAPCRAFCAAAKAGYQPCIPAAATATATAVAAARVPTSSLP